MPPPQNHQPEPQAHCGARLRQARRRARKSADDAAVAVGVSRSTIHGAERGDQQLSDWQIETLAELYGFSPDWIRTGDPALRPKVEGAAAPAQAPPAPPPRSHLEPDPSTPDPCYRLLCPECGASLDPRIAAAHLEAEHDLEHADEAAKGLKRDPAPWIHKAKGLTDLLDETREIIASKPISRSERRFYDAQYDVLMEWLEELERIGPERFRFNASEWPPRG